MTGRRRAARRGATAALALACSAPGCATLLDLTGANPRPFGGARLDLEFLVEGPHWKVEFLWVLWPFALIDLPLSLALDVALLPITLPHTIWSATEPRPEAPSMQRPGVHCAPLPAAHDAPEPTSSRAAGEASDPDASSSPDVAPQPGQ